MSKHTAGPWSVTEDGEICAGAVPLSGICIGTLYAAEDYPCLDPEDEATCDEEYKANAKLIAAAPELLEAICRLEVAANTTDYCYRNRPENFAMALKTLRDDAEKARAAIAKATGEA